MLSIRKNRSALIVGVLLLQASLYYILLETTRHIGVLVLLTTLFGGMLYRALVKRKKMFIGCHVVLTLLMFADVIHFKYFNQNLSFHSLGYASQLADVTGTLRYLIGWQEVLFATAPLWIALTLFKSKGKDTPSQLKTTQHKVTFAVGLVGFCVLLLWNPLHSDLVTSIQNQEFFTYHMKDLYHVVTGSDEPADIAFAMEHRQVEGQELYGIAEGRNLIVIQVESLQDMVVNRRYGGQEITPVLNDLTRTDSLYFTNYFQMLGRGNTSDAEFVSHNSIYAPLYGQAYDIYRDNTFHGLPWLLQDEGYETLALHGYKKEFWNRETAYPGQGFEEFISEEDYEIKEHVGFGLADHDFFDQSIPHLKELKQPFYSFFVTLTCHNPYDMPEKYRQIKLNAQDQGNMFGDYLQAAHYTDMAIGQFIEQLKAEGLYENSVIVIYGDHFGLSSKDPAFHENVSRFIGHDYDFDEMMNIPLLIHIPGMGGHSTIETVGGHIDLLPTLMNVMGLETENPYLFGQDLVNARTGFVASQTYMIKGSFIQDDIVFSMSRDGVFNNSRAWSRSTREPVDLEACREGYERAMREIDQAMRILKNDMIGQVMEENKGLEVVVEVQQVEPEKLIAHAGARLDGHTYTNAKEALDKAYADGYRYIEVDFEWTADGEIVLLHGWDGFITKFFGEESKQYTLDEFMSFDMINGWTQMSLEDLMVWTREHPDVFIVTDAKADNPSLLAKISENYPELRGQIIPQIYYMEEYIKAQYLGFDKIIYTLYRSSNTHEEILDFAKHNELLAVTMPIERAKSGLPEKLKELGVFTYSHTINDVELAGKLEDMGIDGLYTDDLLFVDGAYLLND